MSAETALIQSNQTDPIAASYHGMTYVSLLRLNVDSARLLITCDRRNHHINVTLQRNGNSISSSVDFLLLLRLTLSTLPVSPAVI